MEKLTVYYDREGNTLSVWFDDPKKESHCEEADDDVVLVKDKDGRVIGFERLNYLSAEQREAGVSIPDGPQDRDESIPGTGSSFYQ